MTGIAATLVRLIVAIVVFGVLAWGGLAVLDILDRETANRALSTILDILAVVWVVVCVFAGAAYALGEWSPGGRIGGR